MDIINDPKPIPGNPTVDGVIIRRDPVDNAIATNVPRVAVQHSPTGFEIGYGGSGPADFALNIMCAFLPATPDDGTAVKAKNGHRVSTSAWWLYQSFKRDFLADELKPGEEIIITADDIRAWIVEELKKDRIG